MRPSQLAFCASWLALVSCGGVSALPPATSPRVAPQIIVTGALAASAWRADADALIAATRSVIESPRFQQVVTARGDLHVSALGAKIEGAVLYAAYLSLRPERRIVPTTITIMRGLPARTSGITALCAADRGTRRASIRLQPYVLRQWRSKSLKARSCAINTLAHELTHAVVEGADDQLFTDDGIRWFSFALVSYGLGTIAQCLYLEHEGNVPFAALARCLSQHKLDRFVGCDQPPGPDELDELGQAACATETRAR